jgi:predicted kinase
VRAKVNSFLLDDPHVSASEKAQAKSEAINYYHLAWEYTQPRQGKLFITSGISGSGKTTVAKKIAQENNGIYIRSDAVRKHLAGLDIETKGTAEIYTDSMNEKTYNKLIELAKILIAQGYTVILDAKFDKKSNREKALILAQTYQVPFRIIYCQAPLGVLQERLAQRQRRHDISDATPDLLLQQEANFEPFSEEEKPYLYFEGKLLHTKSSLTT